MNEHPLIKNSNQYQKFEHYTSLEAYHDIEESLDALFNPFIRVIPEKDWSEIKAIWIPFLHHDYKNEREKSQEIILLHKSTDKFGSVQGYLLSRNENYLPYLATFFNPELANNQVIEYIIEASNTIVETQSILSNKTTNQIVRKSIIGATKSGMLIHIITNESNLIIDAFPVYNRE